jgi:hypothetical protein
MTSDEVYKLIETNGLTLHGDIEHFAALVASAEREACAIVCDDLWEDDGTAYECAEAIRARGQA